ncbi:MAG: OmpH family outer membrane protein [Muribaculaceae bacterium]|nr:OmpH family outer membrane protein [Muribaculaceae bacterium]
MMKRILMIAVALLPLMLMAQARIGVVNSQQLFDLMPEKAAAEAQLKSLSDQYHAEYELLKSEFDKKYADYQTVAADASMPETIKERRVQELQESDRKMREFEHRAADDIAARRAALTRPITDKIQSAIRAAGEQGNFDLVLDTAVTPVAYTGPATVDITPLVKAILGL